MTLQHQFLTNFFTFFNINSNEKWQKQTTWKLGRQRFGFIFFESKNKGLRVFCFLSRLSDTGAFPAAFLNNRADSEIMLRSVLRSSRKPWRVYIILSNYVPTWTHVSRRGIARILSLPYFFSWISSKRRYCYVGNVERLDGRRLSTEKISEENDSVWLTSLCYWNSIDKPFSVQCVS